MNFLKKFMGSFTSDEVACLPLGKLFLTRSSYSPKGAFECLYNDCVLSVKRTKPFCYQLSVIRAYQEGEMGSQSDDGEGDDDNEESIAEEAHNHDERVFFLSQDLNISTSYRDDGTRVINWLDVNGDIGERLEFAVDEEIKNNEVDNFMNAVYACLYEQKYGVSADSVPEKDLKEEFQVGKHNQPEYHDGALHEIRLFNSEQASANNQDMKATATNIDMKSDDRTQDEFVDAPSSPEGKSKSGSKPEPSAQLFKVDVRVYNSDSDAFDLVAKNTDLQIKEVGRKSYLVTKTEGPFEVEINKELNLTYKSDVLSAFFNYRNLEEPSIETYLLMFDTEQNFKQFQKAYDQALISTKVEKVTKADMDFIAKSLETMDLSQDSHSEAESDSDGDDSITDDEQRAIKSSIRGKTTEKYSLFVPSDDEDGDNETFNEEQNFLNSKQVNSGLAVGNANDRSYVTRGDRLGVFRHTDDGMSYYTTIDSVTDAQGKKFDIKDTMLYQRDNAILLTRNDVNDTNVYKMDLSRGHIVDSWDADDSHKLSTFAPTSKFSQLTNEQVLVGASSNSLFHIDPRLSGSKIVDGKSHRVYKTNPGFEHLAVTENGHIAAGSKDGKISLFETLTKKARTSLPSIGESYEGLDVTKDGRFIVATCKSSLLLIDTKIGPDQKNAGDIGFNKYFDADKKPVPKRLTLSPEHVSQITLESGEPEIKFTRAVFNTTLLNGETMIITSVGQFIISWSLPEIRKKWKGSVGYKIHRYSENVVRGNFSYDYGDEVLTALQNHVVATPNNLFKRASRSTIVTGPRTRARAKREAS